MQPAADQPANERTVAQLGAGQQFDTRTFQRVGIRSAGAASREAAYGKLALVCQSRTCLSFNCSWLRLVAALALLVSGALSSIAEEEGSEKYTLESGQLKKGGKAYTFQKSTELKSAPSAISPKITELVPGSSVSIESVATNKLTVNGLEDFWYKTKTAKGELGYIWGGNLSKTALDISSGRLLVLVLEGKGTSAVQKLCKAILIKDGAAISEARFPPIEMPDSHFFAYSVGAIRFKADEFAGKPIIARFFFNYGACDYPNGDVLVGITNNKVKFLLEETRSGNEVGSSTFKYVLPSDKGGKPNKLIVDFTVENFEEKKKTKSREIFRWDSDHFTKEK